jgi:glucosylceramidase
MTEVSYGELPFTGTLPVVWSKVNNQATDTIKLLNRLPPIKVGDGITIGENQMKIRLIQTAKNLDDRLQEKQGLVLTETCNEVNLKIDTQKSYQKILGFGGAFTEAASYTLSRMSKEKRDEVLESYFNKETGLAYNIGRVHIHSCDFALGNYTYVKDHDESLESFDISRDFEYVIPMLKDAMTVRDDEIELLASPWSPPAWMKTNNEMNHGGQLLPKYFSVWATYYTKFIEAYENAGLNIWGITVQNEPAAVQTWDSCIYSAEEERDFVKNYLGPIMYEKGYADKKILIWDHNRDIIVERTKPIFEDPEASKYVWGTGIHWYVSEEFEKVGQVHDLFPDKHLLFTEGCQEGGVHLNAWHTGERYGRNIIGDLNNWNEGFLDWNLVLDETGGPNHVGNLCDAPIIADTTTNTLHYNSSYYYIGHFSKYITPDSVRVDLSLDLKNVWATAFKRPDGKVVLVVMNESDLSQKLSIDLDGVFYEGVLPEHSIQTIIYEK